ncbi:glycosyltransferase family 2 protein [Roseivirga misakiensis]|uniref:Glycosyl transferase family 2 n=1 Tax=Roseivirga misakiensis TaxID=1563681 RepID=A0A1E5SK10_9BACT|nr:glycosyltransferase family 2 protein [Roseivirga misakiensis]OEJ99450.1 glycosyl transferase family 2 [Roseivirga misakiensis]
MTQISIVIPLYNEEESLPELIEWISRVMNKHGFLYEIILVDDGSDDKSWTVIESLAPNHPIKGIKFNMNYGKSAALNVGFKHTVGEVVITMDADLQDSPDEIPELYEMVKSGTQLVSGWKKKRFDPISKTVPSKLFNGVTRILSGIKLHDFNCGLKAYDQRLVKTLDIYGEMHRYIPVIAKRNGFNKIGEKVVEHRARKYGKTKFGLERFIYGFLDLLSISFVSRYKKRPMHFFGSLGTVSFLLGFISVIWIVWEKVRATIFLKTSDYREVVDQPLFFIAITAIIIGVQLFLAGFVGEMMVMNSHKRNDYIYDETIGLDQ